MAGSGKKKKKKNISQKKEKKKKKKPANTVNVLCTYKWTFCRIFRTMKEFNLQVVSYT